MEPSTSGAGQHLGELPYHLLAAEGTSWYDIPGVRLVGAVLGTLLLIAALRSMFGRGGR
ncbi:hypothetical protein I0C86_08705 [Plantactinospora sp. S1510]|uniref:Uncharacterized protein n=1 Tax=Plantactinospora alkalitolerans TaxID=2789879 RepID=A0ABS0GSI9_9ACTN|nr:hypothetical protein [Plantactinospora alkalitolerans]MBF9129061.1 hypothetical protein [Plantactinospora alkalitolerans]